MKWQQEMSSKVLWFQYLYPDKFQDSNNSTLDVNNRL